MFKLPKLISNNIIKTSNEAIFGPLQIKGDFCYNILENIKIDNELLEYVKHINNEYYTKHIDNIIQLIDNSVFSRVIRLDLGHINPIVGLITVSLDNNSYTITHISIHKSFRKQGLCRLLLMALANFINKQKSESGSGSGRNNVLEPDLPLINIIIPEHIDDLINIFRTLKFNEMHMHSDIHMLKSIDLFLSIIDSPI